MKSRSLRTSWGTESHTDMFTKAVRKGSRIIYLKEMDMLFRDDRAGLSQKVQKNSKESKTIGEYRGDETRKPEFVRGTC